MVDSVVSSEVVLVLPDASVVVDGVETSVVLDEVVTGAVLVDLSLIHI